MPSEAFKPRLNNKKIEIDSQVDDMEIDENQDFNSSKVKTLASFYPSSCIKATKDLEKHSQTYEMMKKSESDMEQDCVTEDDKIQLFHHKCQNEFIHNKLRKADIDTLDIPEEVSEYADEILDHMHKTENDFLPKYGYMKSQPDINEKMRAILVDWLIEVHFKFKLLPETLFITVNIIDRFLEKTKIKRQRLQLLGVTAMWIA